MLKKKEKEKVIDELINSLKKSTIVITTDYRGLKAKELVTLRRQLRANGIEYRVAKNTLTKLAAEKAGKKELEMQ
jgi:large subunit ribosomal protein L10